MRRAHVAMLALLLSVLLFTPALAQMGGPGGGQGAGAGGQGREGAMGRGAAADREAHEAHARDWANLSEQARTRGLERAEQARLFARFTYQDGTATGRFVSFDLDPPTGALRNHAVRLNDSTTGFFSSVTPAGFTGNGTPAVHGAKLHLEGANATFSAHNNPTGLFQYRGGGLTVVFTAAEGATVTAEADNRSAIVAVAGVHGHVILNGNGTLAVDGATVTVATGEGGGVLFMAHPSGPDAGAAAANLHAVRDAISQGEVGGILAVVDVDGTPVTDATTLGVAMRARDVAQGRANVTVSSPDPAAKSVVVLLGGDIIDPARAATVTVTLDGRPIPRAANATAALDASTGQASFHVTNATQGVQVIVSVPGFSEHDIGISATTTTGTTPVTTTPVTTVGGTVPATTSPTGTAGGTPTGTTPATGSASGGAGGEENGTPGFGVLLLVAGLAAAALALRRR